MQKADRRITLSKWKSLILKADGSVIIWDGTRTVSLSHYEAALLTNALLAEFKPNPPDSVA